MELVVSVALVLDVVLVFDVALALSDEAVGLEEQSIPAKQV